MKLSDYLYYPAIIVEEDHGYIINIRDWPGTFSQADTFDEAVDMAYSLILDMATFYVQDNKEIPHGLKAQKDDVVIDIPYDIAIKFMLRNAMREEHYRPIDLSKKLGITPQKLNQDLGFTRKTKLDTIASLFKAIGRSLSIEC